MNYAKSITLLRLRQAKAFVEELGDEDFEYFKENGGIQLEYVLEKYGLRTEVKTIIEGIGEKKVVLVTNTEKLFTLYQFYAVYFKMDFHLVYSLFNPLIPGLHPYQKSLNPLKTLELTKKDYLKNFNKIYQDIIRGQYDNLMSNKGHIYTHVKYRLRT